MTLFFARVSVFLPLSLAVLVSLPGCATLGETSLGKVLPNDGFPGNWRAAKPLVLFDKATISNHINDESELFLPYGFLGAAYVQYTNDQYPDAVIEADVYEMGSPLDAFGIYSNFRYPEAEFIPMGCEGFVTDRQLMFYKNVYFVRLKLVGSVADSRHALVACADAIRRRLPRAGHCPREVALLHVEGMTPRTETYTAESLLGYTFFPRGLVAKATRADASGSLFVAMLEDDAAAQVARTAYRSYLLDGGARLTTRALGPSDYDVTRDPLHKGVVFGQISRFVYGVIGLEDTTEVPPIFFHLHERLTASIEASARKSRLVSGPATRRPCAACGG